MCSLFCKLFTGYQSKPEYIANRQLSVTTSVYLLPMWNQRWKKVGSSNNKINLSTLGEREEKEERLKLNVPEDGQIHGNRRNMQSYILTYSRL